MHTPVTNSEVGSAKTSKVCLPVWKNEPAEVDQNVIKSLFVGAERFKSLDDRHVSPGDLEISPNLSQRHEHKSPFEHARMRHRETRSLNHR